MASLGQARLASRVPATRLRTGFASIPPEALLVGLGLFALLALFVRADPTPGMSFSVGPFTDEAYNTVNARNLVVLGRWSTDEWNLYLVNLPFSALEALTFRLLGVGLVQARLAMVAAVSLASVALVWGLARPFGRPAALLAGLGFGCSALVLYYGRLAFVEDLVALFLTLGTLVLAKPERLSLRWGVVGGALLALAIGTKPVALFPVGGILACVGLAALVGAADRRALRWVVGAAAGIVAGGLLWALFIWLPNREAVAVDLTIWPKFTFPTSPQALVHNVAWFVKAGDGVTGPMLGPIFWLAAVAGIVALVGWRHLPLAARPVVAAAIGWSAPTFAVLSTASYSPNRYAVILAPGLALVAAGGLAAVWAAAHEPAETPDEPDAANAANAAEAAATRREPGRARRIAALVAVVAIVAAAAPGLTSYAHWMSRATYREVAVQNHLSAVAPAGVRVAGGSSALLLMKSSAITVITGVANRGDQYALGTRWYVSNASGPAPLGVPPEAWAAAERLGCSEWRNEIMCLFHVR